MRSRISRAALLVKVTAAIRAAAAGLTSSARGMRSYAGDDAGLAAAGTGQHQQRAVDVMHRGQLLRIESLHRCAGQKRGRILTGAIVPATTAAPSVLAAQAPLLTVETEPAS
jgi:hypothetical protein